MPRCGKCGKEFDSERGLKVHSSQVHDGEPEVLETKKEASVGNLTFRLNIRHALVLAFAVGIVTGGFFSLMAVQLGGATGFLAAAPSNQGGSQPTAQPNTGSNGGSPSDGSVDPSQISLKNEPVLGDKNAPVTIVAYEDFECPFCQKFEKEAFSSIVKNYVDTGKAKIVWKDFPLTSLHPWAAPAAAAMECVYRQSNDAFWAVNKKVYENQNTISKDTAVSKILDWAAQQGVSKSAVQNCIKNGDPLNEVKQDEQEGSSVGVSGTPTLFINGKRIVGAYPYSAFKQVIDSELQQ